MLECILVIVGLYNYALVAIILLRTNRHQAGRNFAWYLLGTGTWSLLAAVLILPGLKADQALWLMRATFVTAAWFSVAWLWFCTDFPVSSSRFRPATIILTLLGFPWCILAWSHYCIVNVTSAPWAQHARPGPLVPLFTLYIFACGITGFVLLISKVVELRGFERLQVRYILLGSIFLLLVGTVPTLILPAITHTTNFAPLGPLATLFVSSTASYAILRFRLMDINIVIRASVVYTITIGMLSLCFALLVPLLNNALNSMFKLPNQAGTFLMALLIALAFQPLRGYVQQLVDKRFFKSVYDYRQTLSEAGNALASNHNREMLVATLTSALVRSVKPRGVSMYLLIDQHNKVALFSTADTVTGMPDTLSWQDQVIATTFATDEVLIADEYIRQAEPQHTLGRQLKDWGAEVVVPLTAGGSMSGVLFLGEKLSGDVYTTDDLALLRILGTEAAIVLDNIRHYDEITLLNEYHERLLQSMQDGVMTIDPNGLVITFNRAAEQITGITADEAGGKRLAESGLHLFPYAAVQDEAIELSFSHADGREIPLLITVTTFMRRWDTANSHLIVFRDLSTLRALEQEKLQAELFSSMGAMAASLAHEIKNPLVPIRTFAHLLPSQYNDAEFREEFSTTVVNEVERINLLVNQMLDLVRKPADNPDLLDLRELLQRLITLVRPECERQAIVIVTEYAEDLPRIYGVAAQLYQAILNVLTNAIQVMPDGGTLSIAVARSEENMCCRITDTGPGVQESDLRRIFEPLYSTKTEGHGLGLAFTYQFIRAHGGDVHAESKPGTGLTIIMMLPVRTDREG